MLELLWLIGTFLFVLLVVVFARKGGSSYLIGLYVAIMIIMNALGSKLITFFGFKANVGIILISAGFLVSDMLCEFFGKKEASRAVWIGIIGMCLFILTSALAVHWIPTPAFKHQAAYALLFGMSIRLALAQIITNIIAQNHDVWAFYFWKRLTKGRHLWLRNNISTITSQVFSTICFFTIAFYGVYDIVPIIYETILAKVLISFIDTPFMYLARYLYKKGINRTHASSF
ncbi:queuosine precursor transporter [Nanoarchaeota archaeon]